MLILDAILEHGIASGPGKTALRRMNRMHGAYDISSDDLRYVLATFVVVPARWMDRFGWRAFSERERVASVHYYRDLGRHMGIRDLPATFEDFADYLDGYERDHFAVDAGGRAVADATLDLMATFPPNDRVPAALVRRFAYGLMDVPLLDAFGYPHPSRAVRWLSESALRGRALVVRRLRPRLLPKYGRDQSSVRGYPEGYDPPRWAPSPVAQTDPEPPLTASRGRLLPHAQRVVTRFVVSGTGARNGPRRWGTTRSLTPSALAENGDLRIPRC